MELRVAVAVMGIREVCVLGYPDGALDQLDEAMAMLVAIIRVAKECEQSAPVYQALTGAESVPSGLCKRIAS